MTALTAKQVDLLRSLAQSQEAVEPGQHRDFLTASSMGGIELLLPNDGDNIPLNRQDLDELIDQGLIRITKYRDYGDINGHVTNAGFAFLQERPVENSQSTKSEESLSDAFEEPQDVPTVFISYSHDSAQHKEWVRRELAERLMASGVRVILDQWHLKFGDDLAHFMEQALRAPHVLIVCTQEYARRVESRDGGIGYEATIITGELLARRPSVEPKFVPMLREGDFESSRPSFLKTVFAADLRPSSKYEDEFRRLLRQLHKQPEHTPPPLGRKPDFLGE